MYTFLSTLSFRLIHPCFPVTESPVTVKIEKPKNAESVGFPLLLTFCSLLVKVHKSSRAGKIDVFASFTVETVLFSKNASSLKSR